MTSRIVSVETFPARYPVTGRFKFLASSASALPTRDTVMVKICDDAGNIGWGQSVPSPTWSYETLETVRTTIDHHLGPALIGLDPFDIDNIWRVLDRTIAPSFPRGSPSVRQALIWHCSISPDALCARRPPHVGIAPGEKPSR